MAAAVAGSEALSARARALAPSPTMAFDARAKGLLAQGRDVINLTAGEPDFPTVPQAADAAIAAIRAGKTHYTEAVGVASLREAIAAKLRAENGVLYAADEIAVTTGAKFALYAAMQVLCDPGDEVLVAAPYWVSYPEQAKLAGARPVFCPTEEADGFILRADALRRRIGPRSRLLVLNSPCNPTGAVIPPDELERIGRLVLEHPRLFVLSDEIYEKMLYGEARHASIAALDPELRRRTVTVNGFSKAFAMTGWRLGYTAADRPVARAIAGFLSQTTSNVTSVAQPAAEAALREAAAGVEAMVAEFARRREVVLARLGSMPLVSVRPPDGAFYVFPNVFAALGRTGPGGRVLGDVEAFALGLLEEGGLATVPGTGFGSAEHVRISYAASQDHLAAGLDRLGAYLAALR